MHGPPANRNSPNFLPTGNFASRSGRRRAIGERAMKLSVKASGRTAAGTVPTIDNASPRRRSHHNLFLDTLRAVRLKP